VSQIDAGIDLASVATDKSSTDEAVAVLQKAIAQTRGVEARDVTLLQRIIGKQLEGRMALAALVWTTGDRFTAKTNLGNVCIRLDQLQAEDGSGVSRPWTCHAPNSRIQPF
jgi:predicted negative regulator of RcsB-dependent stress response